METTAITPTKRRLLTMPTSTERKTVLVAGATGRIGVPGDVVHVATGTTTAGSV
jgi:hypothetical protein